MPIRISDPSIPEIAVAADTMALLVEDNGGPTSKIQRGNFNKTQALPDIAALDSIASDAIIAREVRVVLDGTDGQPQTWIYDPASTAAQSATVRVPSDSPTSGRWVTRDHAGGSSDEGNPPAPTITTINPNFGAPGQPGIVITGTNLLGGTVEFTALSGGRIQAIVTNDAEAELTVSIPTGAVSGPIYVTTTAGEVQSPSAFTVIGAL